MGCLGLEGTGAMYEFDAAVAVAAEEFTGAETGRPDAVGSLFKGWLLVGVLSLFCLPPNHPMVSFEKFGLLVKWVAQSPGSPRAQ